MLHAMTVRGLHPVFRIQRSSAAAFNGFRDGDRDDARVRITPGKEALRKLKAAGFATPAPPVVLRLVRYDIADERYVLATTLDDPDRYSVADLSDLHHGRWSIEELYKTSKHVIAVDEFHGRTERGVRQEPCAHFNLIAMERLFSSQGDSLLDDMHEGDLPKRRTNFPPTTRSGGPCARCMISNALAMLAVNLEEMILAQTAALADAVGRMADSILAVRARLRPGRSFPRRSRKPVGKRGRKREQTA